MTAGQNYIYTHTSPPHPPCGRERPTGAGVRGRITNSPSAPESTASTTVEKPIATSDRFSVELTADGDGPPADVRLRRWLKLGLRCHGLRCVGVADVPEVPTGGMAVTNRPGKWRRLSRPPAKKARNH